MLLLHVTTHIRSRYFRIFLRGVAENNNLVGECVLCIPRLLHLSWHVRGERPNAHEFYFLPLPGPIYHRLL